MFIFAVEYIYGPEAEAARVEYRPKHREWLAAQAEAEVVLASGPYADGAGALLIFRAENEAAVQQIVSQDPMTIGGGVTGLKISGWNPVIGQLSQYV
ncbi:YciI family protein [Arthrobacter antibioticus]|uniref:YciI family protein n=1 Tax=Arthrobacter sp. H35-MC1 TaxID=3046203 RepID=UPI0024BA20DC|nr:YciI family protein [Arthrobacter sp. H35-MC1]MDJ0317764.1 YciI family protein [Arthrobacter sp. H35-MC1]